jgi:hypothetical protein
MSIDKRIGTIRHRINVSEEYENLANEDEMAARSLKNTDQFRHSIYFYIQAMEKHIKSKIFSMVNPNNEYFRKKNQNHSITDTVNFFIEIINTDDQIKKHIKNQLDNIFNGLNFQFLHNNLRYPFYSENHNDYSIIQFSLKDCLFIEKINEVLKKYLNDLSKL